MGLKEDLCLIKEEEIKQNTLYLEIGEYYYNHCREQAEGKLKTLCDEVTTSMAQVEAYLNAGEDSEEGYFCVQCDGEVPEGSAFCNHCGVQLLIEEVLVVEESVEEPATNEAEEPVEEVDEESVEELTEESAEELVEESAVELAEENAEELVEGPAKVPAVSSFSRPCSNCGNALSVADVFCTECGTKVPEETTTTEHAPEPEKRFCENCGSKLIPGNAFCTGCGTRI